MANDDRNHIASAARHGATQQGIRERNERLVLTLLRRSPGLPKAELARRTGLSAQTISRLIAALEADGLILRGDPQRGRVGQPSIPLDLDPEGAFFLGLKVGRRSVELVAIDLLGRIVDREKRVYDYPAFDDILNFARCATDTLVQRLGPIRAARISGLGIAQPFHLWGWAARIGVSPDRMADWKVRDLKAELADSVALPIFLQNDATAACSAELVFGTSPLPANFASFYVAFFIGGGLVLGDALFTGGRGNAAGMGPLMVPDRTGRIRPLIDLASLSTLEKTLLREGIDPQSMWIDPEGWPFPDALVREWVRDAAYALAQSVRAVQTILDLDAILIDGWLPEHLRADLLRCTKAELEKLDMTGMHVPDIRLGTIGADARSLGAASLPLRARFLVDAPEYQA